MAVNNVWEVTVLGTMLFEGYFYWFDQEWSKWEHKFVHELKYNAQNDFIVQYNEVVAGHQRVEEDKDFHTMNPRLRWLECTLSRCKQVSVIYEII